ncbi:cytosolic sulfotransferase 17-like [Actinidia eriantha]|uniref:cytosolic sulfotransferase 17-like n=1 Tax=Actinidia eriantha TaxID=165200 RepID=UPI002587F3D5|nr:cytosolic sulfotransferase 17-like [Actinidia eriantha]
MIRTLPKGRGWRSKEIVLYQGCWLPPNGTLKAVLLVQNHFNARPTDIFLAAFMKCGTTWLRALMFATINRSQYDFSTHPLLNSAPISCFPILDLYIFNIDPIAANLEALPSPRLFATHIPYSLLPKSVTSCGCKIVYIWRDPKDVLVSKWHFMNKIKSKGVLPLSFPEAFELFCEGVSEYGPFWDHVLGYWKARQESPNNILFLKYEDMMREPAVYLKTLAEFMGVPFSPEEEEYGVVEKIIELCSFKNLSNLEVNKTGVKRFTDEIVIENQNFFRKGQIGDFKNYLTGEMPERLDSITMKKFNGTGLIFCASTQK